MPSDPTLTNHAAIQVHIEETLKLCRIMHNLQAWDKETPAIFQVHARAMLPRYARALRAASELLVACRGARAEILSILNGESERRDDTNRDD